MSLWLGKRKDNAETQRTRRFAEGGRGGRRLGSHRVNCSRRLWGGGRGEKVGSRLFTDHGSTGMVTLSIVNYVVLHSNGQAFELMELGVLGGTIASYL
jgi:hypothetical protein